MQWRVTQILQFRKTNAKQVAKAQCDFAAL
jgi:hypothetical protein